MLKRKFPLRTEPKPKNHIEPDAFLYLSHFRRVRDYKVVFKIGLDRLEAKPKEYHDEDDAYTKGTIASLLKQVGEQVEADEEVASVETGKIHVAVNAPEAGVLREFFVSEGDTVTVGQDLTRLKTGVEGSTPSRGSKEAARRGKIPQHPSQPRPTE
ncbi:Uncharacterized protein TPAR_07026 [Tolypocladium paradoxum]|uniref:Lipoyl-binding domain-containing protein n=1 Tax=Tolypocladium paradoxum TaxID=94208 RepID=A0A2S4KRH0_9HYPO|nr:Uncharacterized protein TPAR_07026 [Tolypocladium paradoxum]